MQIFNDNLLLIYVVILATFVGMEVINNIPSILHTPLMSGSNAISGIVIIGGCVAALRIDPTENYSMIYYIMAYTSIVLAMINVVGGYMVTDRMLGMFKKKSK